MRVYRYNSQRKGDFEPIGSETLFPVVKLTIVL